MLITSVSQWRKVLAELSRFPTIAIDTETTGLVPAEGDRICMVSLYHPEAGAFSAPFRMQGYAENLAVDELRQLQPLIDTVELTGHNVGPFDLNMFRADGIDITRARVWDTLFGVQLWDDSLDRYNLKWLGDNVLQRKDASQYERRVKEWLKDPKHKRALMTTYDWIPVSLLSPYAEQDVVLTWDMREHVEHTILARGDPFPALLAQDMRWSRFLADLGWAGLELDQELCETQLRIHRRRLRELQQDLASDWYSGLNPNSPIQIMKWLSARYKVSMPTTEDWMLRMTFKGHPDRAIVEKVLEYRARVKACTSWLEVYLKSAHRGGGRVRSGWGIDAATEAAAARGNTRTLRLRSSKPNLQAVPVDQEPRYEGEYVHRVRYLFKAKKGCKLVGFDYSQIEVRLAAHYAQEHRMIKVFREGGDVHQSVADDLNMPRYRAKRLNLGTIYSIGKAHLAQELTKETLDVVKESETGRWLSQYRSRYPGFQRTTRTAEMVFSPGCERSARLGCRCEVPHRGFLTLWDGRWAKCGPLDEPRKGFNLLIATGVSQLLKRATLAVLDFMTAHALKSQVVLQVHDELIIEMPEEELRYVTSIRNIMQDIAPPQGWRVPIVVDYWIRDRWSENIPQEVIEWNPSTS